MRSCSAVVMSLNELASTSSSGSWVPSRRVSSRPPAIALAACAAAATGRTRGRRERAEQHTDRGRDHRGEQQ